MRHDVDRIRDILKSARSIIERLRQFTLKTLPDDCIKASFYDVIVIGEAIRELVARKEPAGQKITSDAPIVEANPEIPWLDWIGMRDMVTHQYFRAAPEVIWRDYEIGEFERLIACCEAWLKNSQPA
jgi:uncharacterized protein with HEPN domain